MLRYTFFILTLVRVFIHKWMLNLTNAFSASVEMTMWFLSFLLLIWCIMLFDLCILHHLHDPGMNPVCSWCMIFLCLTEFGLLIFCWEFLHLYLSRILSYSFFSWCCFVRFWYQDDDGGHIEWLWECFLLFSQEVEKDQYKFFFVCLVEFPIEAIQNSMYLE